jgi:hypothetical protein
MMRHHPSARSSDTGSDRLRRGALAPRHPAPRERGGARGAAPGRPRARRFGRGVREDAPSHRPRRAEDSAGDRRDDGGNLEDGGREAEVGGARVESGVGRLEVGWGELGDRTLKLENNDAESANNRDLAAFW